MSRIERRSQQPLGQNSLIQYVCNLDRQVCGAWGIAMVYRTREASVPATSLAADMHQGSEAAMTARLHQLDVSSILDLIAQGGLGILKMVLKCMQTANGCPGKCRCLQQLGIPATWTPLDFHGLGRKTSEACLLDKGPLWLRSLFHRAVSVPNQQGCLLKNQAPQRPFHCISFHVISHFTAFGYMYYNAYTCIHMTYSHYILNS